MEVFVYDPAQPTRQRPWALLLGPYDECDWNKSEFATKSGSSICNGIIVAHYSKLEENDISQEAITQFADKNKECTIIVISGGTCAWKSTTPNVYFSKTPVSYDLQDPFQGHFYRFKKQLVETKIRAFKIFDPDIFPATLTSIVILCQLYTAVAIGRDIVSPDLIEEFYLSQLMNSESSIPLDQTAKFWPQLCSNKWWRSSLGVGSDDQGKPIQSELQKVLNRLSQELETGALSNDDSKTQPLKSRIIELLNCAQIEPKLITDIWRSAKTFI